MPSSHRTSQIEIVLAPAVVIELQKYWNVISLHQKKAFKACEIIHSFFYLIIQLIINFTNGILIYNILQMHEN